MTASNTTSYPTRGVSVSPEAPIPDSASNFGQTGKLQNVRYANGKVDLVAIAIASSTTPVLTAAQFITSIWDVSGTPGGAWTLTTPTAAQIIAALPNTIPGDGTFNFIVTVFNDGTGQTATVTAGSNVTVTGTATVATATLRGYLVNVNVNAGTVTMLNLGSTAL